jgi:enoyl-CoA hydratase/carnithine racemase
MSTAESSTALDERIAERFTLKAIVEACLVLEEGIAGVREIDLGLMLGTGMVPGPFARADFRGLDDVLAALERAEREWGEQFAPPLILRRLVAQGRLGAKSGQGFYPYPQPEPGYENAPVKLDRRGDDIAVLWLDNPPANSLSPAVVEAFERAWSEVEGQARAVIVASPNPALFCAGADIKAFTTMDAQGGRAMLERAHALLRSFERSRTMTIAAVNGMALGGGCELTMGCDVRIAAYSASFGQPEINLGLIPGYAGSQRLARLVGKGRALELLLTGEAVTADEAYRIGLVNRVVPAAELAAAAKSLARALAEKAPVAVRYIIDAVNRGLEMPLAEAQLYEATLFGLVATTEDMREGTKAFLEKRKAQFKGR